MPELSTWPTQNSGPTGTIDSREAATHIGALVYPHTSALKAKSGFRPGPGASPGVVTATGTPDGFVHVAPFQLLLQNIRGSGLGTYITGLDAQKDINILATPADPTNPRDDLIVAQQSDIFDADANSDFVVRHVPGTPAPAPSDPAVSGSTNFITLARVRVVANATSISGSNITDLRTSGHAKSLVGGLHTVALGGILPVASQAQRDALTGVYNGLGVWRQDVKRLELTDGSAWLTMARNASAVMSTAQNLTVSNTTLQNLTALALPVIAGTYRWRLELPYEQVSNVPDIKLAFTFPAASSASYAYVALTAGVTGGGPYSVEMNGGGLASGTPFVVAGTVGLRATVIAYGHITFTAAGTVQVQAAQNTSDPSTVVVHAGAALDLMPA